MNGVSLAIERAGGTQHALARRLNITGESVRLWLKAGRVPPERVLRVEQITGVHRHYLNPDIYPERPRKAAPAKRKRARKAAGQRKH